LFTVGEFIILLNKVTPNYDNFATKMAIGLCRAGKSEEQHCDICRLRFRCWTEK
jgi:hypothetical protein